MSEQQQQAAGGGGENNGGQAAGQGDSLLGFRPDAGDRGQGGEQAGTGNGGTAGNGGEQQQGSAARFIEFGGERLDVPEQFWDKAANAPNVGALLKSQTDLRKQIGSQPKAPEAYEIRVPDAVKDKVEVKADDARVKGAMDWGKKWNIPQDAFDELVAMELTNQAGSFEAEDKVIVEEIQADIAKLEQQLGREAGVKVAALDKWLVELVGKDDGMVSAVRNLRASADGTLFLMQMRSKMGEPQIPGSRDGGDASGGTTLAELQKMQSDPRYWKDKDPAFIRQVEDGYKRLYPN